MWFDQFDYQKLRDGGPLHLTGGDYEIPGRDGDMIILTATIGTLTVRRESLSSTPVEAPAPPGLTVLVSGNWTARPGAVQVRHHDHSCDPVSMLPVGGRWSCRRCSAVTDNPEAHDVWHQARD